MNNIALILLLHIIVLSHEKANAQGSRLIGRANYVWTGSAYVPIDTTGYFYATHRGGDLCHPLNFDSAITKVYGSSLTNYKRILKTYTGSGSLTRATTSTWNASTWRDSCRHSMTSSGGHLTSPLLCETWSGTSWDSAYKKVFTYVTSGDILNVKRYAYTSSGFVLDSERVFTYGAGTTNSQGQQYDFDYEQGTFYNTNDYSYTVPNRELFATSTHGYWSGSTIVYCFRYNYNYDGSGNLITKTFQVYNATTGAWDNKRLFTYSSFTTGHMPLLEIDMQWDTTGAGFWYNYEKFDYTYNSFNQMTSRTGYAWSGSAWAYALGQSLSYYYYEGYNPLAVASKDETMQLSIFPNPAKDVLHISIQQTEPAALTIALYDMAGREVFEANIAAKSKTETNIHTTHLPAGNYVVKVTGRDSARSEKVIISHQ